jgi:acyl carrier protein
MYTISMDFDIDRYEKFFPKCEVCLYEYSYIYSTFLYSLRRMVVTALVTELGLEDDYKQSTDEIGVSSYLGFDMAKSLDQYGMDSITAAKLVGNLSEEIGVPLSIFMFLRYVCMYCMCVCG